MGVRAVIGSPPVCRGVPAAHHSIRFLAARHPACPYTGASMMNASARLAARLTVAATIAVTGTACLAADLSEADFLDDLPTVLSVSRLAQPLNETPGAVTVLDREMIRLSGARELVDLLRMVPGFVVGHINGANPVANYHGDFDALTRRLQVFVDGRSVYSTMLAGNVSHPMMGVVLDDIERVEVLRGSNSAAYGANAFSGVVNVVTRNAADVPKATVSLSLGEAGIADRGVRLAFGDPEFAMRVTAARSGDNGFYNVLDDKRVDQLHFRGDLRPTVSDELSFSLGSVAHAWGVTTQSRMEHWRNAYAQGSWLRRLGEDDNLRVSASFDEEKFVDQVFSLTALNLPFRADGTGRRLSLEAEHSLRLGTGIRLVWGGQLRHEELDAPDIFTTSATQSAEMMRWFGNIEWRPHRAWVVNAGALLERHSIVGSHTAPRLAVNYHVAREHTLRIGTTQAQRIPTLFELRGDWRTAVLPGVGVRASGGLRPERLVSNEIGYLGEFAALGLRVDVRAFEESGSSIARYFGGAINDVVNKDPYRKRGWEMQMNWQPRAETRILLNHSVIGIRSEATGATKQTDELSAPSRASAFMWFESLPLGYEFSLAAYFSKAMTWGGLADLLNPTRRVDLRFGRRFKLGPTRADAALTVQSASGGYQDGSPTRQFPRRAFVSVRLEF